MVPLRHTHRLIFTSCQCDRVCKEKVCKTNLVSEGHLCAEPAAPGTRGPSGHVADPSGAVPRGPPGVYSCSRRHQDLRIWHLNNGMPLAHMVEPIGRVAIFMSSQLTALQTVTDL